MYIRIHATVMVLAALILGVVMGFSAGYSQGKLYERHRWVSQEYACWIVGQNKYCVLDRSEP